MVPLKKTTQSKKTTAYKGGDNHVQPMPKAKPVSAKPKATVSSKPKATVSAKPKAKRETPKPPPMRKMPAMGGSVLSDVSKLAVPFGLLAARNSLEAFLKNRKARKPPVAPVKPVKPKA
jgi:hypothetical protein